MTSDYNYTVLIFSAGEATNCPTSDHFGPLLIMKTVQCNNVISTVRQTKQKVSDKTRVVSHLIDVHVTIIDMH